jgi:hypothetical protein
MSSSGIIRPRVLRLIVTANFVPSSPILVTLMVETIHSAETSVPTRATRRNVTEGGIILSHLCKNLKYYRELTDWSL